MRYTKPYLTVDQQLERLQQRGLGVTDAGRAREALCRIGYYRLSGYWFPFRVSEHQLVDGVRQTIVGDAFKPGVEFRHIVDLYVFDKTLRLVMLDAIERVEIALRSSIALRMGQYGPWPHRDATLLDGKFSRRADFRTGRVPHQVWLEKLDQEFGRSNEQFAVHYRAKYDDPPPIWIVTEVWDFGMLSRFYAGMAFNDRKAIAEEYGLSDPKMLEAWLKAINFLRNVCAHHTRLWNRALVRQGQFPGRGDIPVLDHLANDTVRQTRLYGTAAALRFLLLKINPSTSWPLRLKGVLEAFPTAPYITLGQTGFPARWHELTLWQVGARNPEGNECR